MCAYVYVLPFLASLSSSWCVLPCCSLSFLFSVSLILCSLVLDIILRSCGSLDPVLSNTSPCHYPVLSLIHLSSYRLIREVQGWNHLQGPACMTAPLTADRLFGLLSVIVPPLLSPPVTPSAARLQSAVFSYNPTLQKAVIEAEIDAGIFAVIWGR